MSICTTVDEYTIYCLHIFVIFFVLYFLYLNSSDIANQVANQTQPSFVAAKHSDLHESAILTNHQRAPLSP